MFLLCAAIALVIVRDAWRDRTPRKPWAWARPDLEWWAIRHTRRERFRVADVLLLVRRRRGMR